MKLTDYKEIPVYNYTPGVVVCTGQNRSYSVPGYGENGPGVEFLTPNDVKYIHSRSPVFKNGLLEFSPEDKKDVYEELHIKDIEKTAFFEREIDSMLLHPTKDDLEKIVGISNVQTMERVRGHMIGLVNAKEDVSNRVVKLVDERAAELKRSPASKSKIQIKEKNIPPKAASEEIADLKAELEQLRSLIAQSKPDKPSPPAPKAEKQTPKTVTRKTPTRSANKKTSI